MISYLIYFFVIGLGLIVGSFLNCIIYRIAKKQSFLFKRSYCPHCKTTLSWQDLFPVFSFVFLRGKCRYCKKPISWQYPLVESFTALLFFLVARQNIALLLAGSVFAFLNVFFLFFIVSILVIIFVYDLKHYIIPDKVIFPAIFIAGLWLLACGTVFNLGDNYYILNAVYSAFAASAFFLAIVLLSRGKGMGMGDVKLAFLMGLVLSFPNIIVALFLSFILGALVGLFLIARGKKKLKSEIPFAPFLVTGTFLALFFGPELIDIYLSLIL